MVTSPSSPLGLCRHDHRTLVGVEGHRWAIEYSFETARNQLGLDHNETRSWMAGTGTSRSSCVPSQCWRPSALAPTPRSQKEPGRGHGPDPLLPPGNPQGRHQPGPAPYRTPTRRRMVMLATGPSSCRTTRTYPPKNTTVMLESVQYKMNKPRIHLSFIGGSSGPHMRHHPRGRRGLRSVFIAGATAVVRNVAADSSKNAFALWVEQLLKRNAPNLVAVALADTMARIAWKLVATGQSYAGKTTCHDCRRRLEISSAESRCNRAESMKILQGKQMV